MIIELYGLPGSGKTTAAKTIVAKEGAVLITMQSRLELVKYSILFFLSHPVSSVWGFFYTVRYAGTLKLFYYKFMNSFLQPNAKYQKARRYPLALIDQGHFQNMIALFEKEISKDVLSRYARSMPKSDMLMVFSVPKDIRDARLAGRGYCGRESLGSEYQIAWRHTIEKNDQIFKSMLPAIVPSYRVVSSTEECLKIMSSLHR